MLNFRESLSSDDLSVLSFATSSNGLKASKFKLQGLKLLILNFILSLFNLSIDFGQLKIFFWLIQGQLGLQKKREKIGNG